MKEIIRVFMGKDSITFMTLRIRANKKLIQAIIYQSIFSLLLKLWLASYKNLRRLEMYSWNWLYHLNQKTFKRVQVHAHTLVCTSMLWEYCWSLNSESKKILREIFSIFRCCSWEIFQGLPYRDVFFKSNMPHAMYLFHLT